MRIRLLGVTGTFHGIDNVQYGQIIDVDEFSARHHIKHGLAEAVDDEPVEESAVLQPEAESAVAKRPRGRPKRVKPPAQWHDDAPSWKNVD